ncbi:MAG: hypothetical protein LBJ43_05035 [Propionibacteriaceae bacterium]|jgi:hypothetical protein|nr:hypothetical protein [Propionibacteriaceae bacterium]
MTQENSPDDPAAMPDSTDFAATVPPPATEPPVAFTDPYDVQSEPDPYTTALLAGALQPPPPLVGSPDATPPTRKNSPVYRILSIVLVVVVAVSTAILFFKTQGTAPITNADFDRLITALSNTKNFGAISAYDGVTAADVDDCEAYAGFAESTKGYAEGTAGYDGDGIVLLVRFLERNDAINFAAAGARCIEQNNYATVTTTEATTGGLFSVVKVYEFITPDDDYPVAMQLAVYRNVAVWNLDTDPSTPITLEQWKIWAGGEFMDAVDAARKK